MWARRTVKSRLEVRIRAAGMVGNEVHYHANSPPVRLAYELAKIFVSAIARVNVVVIDDVVAVVAHRPGDRHQPDAVRAEIRGAGRISIVDVIKTRGQSTQVSNPVAIGIGNGADESLVEDAIPPPLLL